MGTVLTRLNHCGIRVTIPECKVLQEALSPAKRDWMLLEPCTMSSSGGIERNKQDWQEREEVLSWFGRREGEARGAYRKYMEEGIAEGRRPELVNNRGVNNRGKIDLEELRMGSRRGEIPTIRSRIAGRSLASLSRDSSLLRIQERSGHPFRAIPESDSV